MLLVLSPFLHRGGKWLGAVDLLLGRETRAQYLSRFVVPGLADPLADEAAARRLAAEVPPDGRAFLWGFAPQVFFLADRQPAGRLVNCYPYLGPHPAPRLSQELLADLRARPPERVLVHFDEVNEIETLQRADAMQLLSRFTALKEWIDANYEIEAREGHFDFYRPKAASEPGGAPSTAARR